MSAFALDIFGDAIEAKKNKSATAFNCESCGRLSLCKNPSLGVYGEGKLKILLVGVANGQQDDIDGIPMSGESGRLIKNAFYKYNVDISQDCHRVNLIRCFVDKEPEDLEIKSCDTFLVEDIERLKPNMIICFGHKAINSVLRPKHLDTMSELTLHGKVIPHQDWNCWVGCMFSPEFIFKTKCREKHIFENDLGNILSYYGKELPRPLDMEGNIVLTNFDEASEVLDLFSESETPVAFDYETSALDPYKDKDLIYSIALSNNTDSGFCIPIGFNKVFSLIEQAALDDKIRKFLKSDVPKVVQNFNMEHSWSVRKLGVEPKNVIWDTMNSYHVAHSRKEMTSMARQVYELVGHEYKNMVDYSDMLSDVHNTGVYNCLDARYTLLAYQSQKKIIEERKLEKFNDMYSTAIYPLARFRDRGILVDRDKFNGFTSLCDTREVEILTSLHNIEAVKSYESKVGHPLNLKSPKQIGELLYSFLGEKCPKQTKNNTDSTDEATLNLLLESAKKPDTKLVVQSIFDLRQNKGFKERVINWAGYLDKDNRIHPTYLLNTALSYRSSAADPPSQNVPKHDKYLSEFRRVVVPKNDCILEVDLSAGEVRGIAMASGDTVLLKEILDGYDSHRYWASLLFEKDMKDVTKDERFRAKNKFVFPSFYGSEPKAECKQLELPLKHVEKVFGIFWNKYKGVQAWQNKMVEFYNTHGYIIGMSGFRCYGPLTKFQICNIPIQGSTFHLVLSALDLIEQEFEQKKIRSVQFGEIHDAILFDTHFDEVEKIMNIVNPIICGKRFEWQHEVPINVEWCIGRNWKEMEELCKY